MGIRSNHKVELMERCRDAGLGKLIWRSDHPFWNSWKDESDVAQLITSEGRRYFSSLASVERFIEAAEACTDMELAV